MRHRRIVGATQSLNLAFYMAKPFSTEDRLLPSHNVKKYIFSQASARSEMPLECANSRATSMVGIRINDGSVGIYGRSHRS